MPSTFVTILGALAVNQALAAPTSSDINTHLNTLGKRGGNTDLNVFGKNSVNFGDQTPWSVLDTMGAHCSGGSCESSWTISAKFTGGENGQYQTGTITVSIQEASYEDWARNALIETLKTLSSNTYKVDHTTYQDGNGCQVATGTPCNPGTPTPIDQYSGSDNYYIRYNPDATKDTNGPSFINVNVASGIDDNSGVLDAICKDVTTVGTAVASVLGGAGVIAAAGFTLGSLLCGS